jgi:HD-like signal output (HDOD) protein/CheY-like chemotaxis protein
MFVDDEPHLLAGLRRGLHLRRRDWELFFAEGGEEALAMLGENPVDIVVSDMRMPGMDGGKLLAAVRERYPATARMILSGQADRASIISALGPTQQYLAKPCDIEVLVTAIERVLSVRELVTDDTLRDLLGGVESLPKPPQVYDDMMAISADPDCSLSDVADVIERDLGTSTEVLRLVNSSFFGLPVKVESVARAITLLGLETIQGLAVAGAVFGRGGTPPPGLDSRTMCREGLHVGMLCKRFAIAEGWPRDAVNDAFFAGLLHRVALPVVARAQPAAWSQVRITGARDPWQAAELETEHFGASSTRATAYLLGLWGFSETVVAAIADQPATLTDLTATPAAQLLTLARWHGMAPTTPLPEEPVTDGYLTPERLHHWRVICQDAPTADDDDPGVEDAEADGEPWPDREDHAVQPAQL